MKRFAGFMLVVAGAVVFAGCGGGGADDVGGADALVDVADTIESDGGEDTATPDARDDGTADTAGDTAIDADDATLVDDTIPGDADDDADAPHPAEFFQPIADRVYAQEVNHTGIEVDRRITDIVDIVLKPADGPAWFDDVVLVAADGVWQRTATLPPREATPDPVKFPVDPTYGQVIGGAYINEGFLVVQPTALWVIAPDGEVLTMTSMWVLGDGEYRAVTQAYGLTILTDNLNISTFGTDGTRLVVTDTQLDVRFATVNKTHTRMYVAGINGYDAEVIEVWESGMDGRFNTLIATVPAPVSGVSRMVADVGIPDDLELVVVGTDGIAGFTAIEYDDQVPLEIQVFAAGRVPLNGATDIAKTADGGFIVTTNGGAIRMMDRGDGPEWRVYNTLRWVADGDVRAVATSETDYNAPIYFGSDAGMTWVTVEDMTMEQKMALLTEKIVLRHDRDGAVADSRLTVPGDLSTNIPWDSDNDGGWTSYWLVAECLRWKETGDPYAKAHFDKSLQAMLNLRLLTGEDWFLARALIRKDGCQLDDCDNPNDGEWYTSPDGEWWVKSDTSNDEVTSHMFMMGPAYDLCADETQKHAIAAHVAHIVGGIIDHGYQLWKPTGECTTYGQFDPEYVNFFGLFGDGGQRSVQTLGALNLAIHVTTDQESKTVGALMDMPGSQKFKDAKAFLMNDENHYDDNVLVSTEPPGRHGNGDGDELSTQGFFPLVMYETDPALKAKWLDGWDRLYHYLNMQQSAVWDAFQGVITGTVPDMSTPERWFRLYPLDLIRWTMHNSHRLDLIPAPQFYLDKDPLRRMRSDGRIVPSDERPNDRHNTSQFIMDGGWGDNVEMDAADVLAAYWMSRYYGFIDPAE